MWNMQSIKQKLHASLAKQPQWVFVVYATLAAFLTYSCMYAFRKTFTVATFDEQYFLGVHYKIWLITSQLIGYTLSKFIGIKLISEMKPQHRTKYILLVVAIAQVALLLFAITPRPWNIIWMFFNGLPLGLVWGLVFSFLEGRKTTELLGAGVSVSFIFSSGFVKSVGKYLLVHHEVSEYWMPFVTGLIFTIPLIVFVWLMNMIPPPNEEDIAQRTIRLPMNKDERKAFVSKFVLILIPLIIIYIFLTVMRDIRDSFAAEIWIELGFGNTPAIFATAEIPVGLGVLIIVGLMVVFKNNIKALNASLLLVAAGFLINIAATLAFRADMISGAFWMIAIGFGLYLGYIVYHALLFERFIAAFKQVGNIGFLFYISDSIGYLGSVSSFMMKNFFSPNISWLSFLGNLGLILSMVAIVLCMVTYVMVQRKYKAIILKPSSDEK
jgi:MFS family permease